MIEGLESGAGECGNYWNRAGRPGQGKDGLNRMRRGLRLASEQKDESQGYFCKWAAERKPVMLLFILFCYVCIFTMSMYIFLFPFLSCCWLADLSVARCGMRSDLSSRPSPFGQGCEQQREQGRPSAGSGQTARREGGSSSPPSTKVKEAKKRGICIYLALIGYLVSYQTHLILTTILRSAYQLHLTVKQAGTGRLTNLLKSQLRRWQSWDSNPVLGLSCLQSVFQSHGFFRLYQRQG